MKLIEESVFKLTLDSDEYHFLEGLCQFVIDNHDRFSDEELSFATRIYNGEFD